MKQTPLYEKHVAMGAKIVEFGGFLMPITFSNILDEHQAVRTSSGVFDVSHMGEILITGKDALNFINYVGTNTVLDTPNKITYTLFTDNNGYTIDDLLVYVINSEKILLVVNASNTDKDYEWLLRLKNDSAIEIKNISDKYGQIALQGPNTINFIDKLLKNKVTDLAFMTFITLPYKDDYILVSRTGYTGEDGFEVYAKNDLIIELFNESLNYAKPCGLGSRDTLRFEASLPLYGYEISDSITPIEAGLNFAVKLDKDFIGKESLLENKNNLKRKVIGFKLTDKGIAREGYEIFKDGKKIGVVTTGYLSPTLNISIGMAIVDVEYTKIGETFDIAIRKNLVSAEVIKKPFYTKKYKI